MREPKLLTSEKFLALMKRYQEGNPVTPSLEALDAEIEQRAYEQLAPEWENGWDFCTQTEFFGDRGTSILIQNAEIDWQRIWDWLVTEYSRVPEGAMINFEVWDSIREGVMIGGEMRIRRLILSDGVYVEETDAEQAGTGQPATRSQSKSEGGDKPQSEAEGCSGAVPGLIVR